MQNTRPTELAVNQVNEVKRLFKRVSDFIRSIEAEETEKFEPTDTNRENLKLNKTLKNYVDRLGIDYPIQAGVLRLRYFDLKPVEKIAAMYGYDRSNIYKIEKEAMEFITKRYFSAQPVAISRSVEL